MKVLRAILIAFLFVSSITTTAFASNPVTGYAQLVLHANPSVPMMVQAEAAFHQLLPDLLTARDKGQVLSFEPNFDAGILTLVYDPSAGTPDLGGRTIYSQPQDALPTGASFAANPGGDLTPAGGGGCLTELFEINLDYSVFDAKCLVLSGHIVGSVRDGSGNVVAIYNGDADAGGSIGFAYFYWPGAIRGFRPGYKITFQEYNGSTLVNTFVSVIPTLKFTSFDKAHSIIHGKSTPGLNVFTDWVHPRWDAANNTDMASGFSAVSGTGSWSTDMGTVPFRGGDWVTATLAQSTAFVYSRTMQIPSVFCILKDSFCYVNGFAGNAASFELIHGTATYDFTGRFDASGRFFPIMRKPGGADLNTSPGDKVTATGVAQYKLPKLTASLDFGTNVVSGQAPANKYFVVFVNDIRAAALYSVYSHSNGVGAYASDFTIQSDLLITNPYVAQVAYVASNSGNETDLFKSYGP